MKKRLFIIASVILFASLIGSSVIYHFMRDKVNTKVEDDIIISSLDEATLTFYFPSNGGLEPKGLSRVLEEIQKRTKNQLNIKLIFKFLDSYTSEYSFNIKDIAAAEGCDAFFFTNEYDISLADLEREGIIMDLTEIFPIYAPKYFSKFSKDELSAVSINNKIMAIPNRLPTAQRKHAMVREDLMQKYSIPGIKNYWDYEFYLKVVKGNEPGLIPAMIFNSSLELFAEANGYVIFNNNLGLVYKWTDPDMKIIPWEQTPEYKNTINTIINWIGKGYAVSGNSIDISVPIGEGKYSSVIGVTGSEIIYNRILQSKGVDFRYKSYSLYQDKPSERSSPLRYTLLVNSRTKNAERVIKFIEWLQSNQENYDLFMYGIEGKDYVLSADKTPVGISHSDSYENWEGQNVLLNIEYERQIQYSSDFTVEKYMNEIESTTSYPPHLGFFPDLQGFKDQFLLRQYTFRDFENKLLNGELKSEDVDTFINDQKQFEIDKVVNELQNQLNAWKASKNN